MSYHAHEEMVAPARKRRELWRLGAGLILFLVMAAVLNGLLFQAIRTLWPDWFFGALVGHGLGTTPWAMLLLLCSFGLGTLAAGLMVRLLHNRAFLTMTGPPAAVMRDFWAALRILMPVMLVLMLIPTPTDSALIPNLAMGTWLAFLPLALIALLIQVSAEEILFRGYLQQQLAARFRSPLIWMLLPSALFAVGHYDPEAGKAAPYVVIWACLFGLAAADLTARAGNLGPAIAMHLVNNASAMLIASAPDNFSGLSLYHLPFSLSDFDQVSPYLAIDLVSLLVAWLACRLGIRR